MLPFLKTTQLFSKQWFKTLSKKRIEIIIEKYVEYVRKHIHVLYGIWDQVADKRHIARSVGQFEKIIK